MPQGGGAGTQSTLITGKLIGVGKSNYDPEGLWVTGDSVTTTLYPIIYCLNK